MRKRETEKEGGIESIGFGSRKTFHGSLSPIERGREKGKHGQEKDSSYSFDVILE